MYNLENENREEDEFGFSRNYFWAKDSAASGSSHKLSDISFAAEQVLITLAEVLCDQLKLRQQTLFKNLPKAQQPFNSLSMDDLLAFLDASKAEENNWLVCLAIHNIDGLGLRDSETQQYLAQIASCSHIYIIGFIDHCGTGRWVTHNSTGAGIYSRYANQNLYKISRDSFQVGSQISLNSHLTKFKDHKLVKTKRHSDGQGCLLSLLLLKHLKNCCLKLVIRYFSSL